MEGIQEPPFAIGRFQIIAGSPFVGVVVRNRVVPLDQTPAAGLRMFDDWDRMVDVLTTWSAHAGDSGMRLDELRVLPPVVPGQVFCSGANFRAHVVDLLVARELEALPEQDAAGLRARATAAMDERARTGRPYVFLGLPSALCGAHDDVVLPADGAQHDWELELGVVIGRRARHVRRADALDHVAGYTIVNDVTTRDLVHRADVPGIDVDFFASKNAPTFFPTGPVLVPARFVDPAGLRIVLRLNGEVMQDGHTSDLIFGVARLVEYLSAVVELAPGDLILMGSPAGNGSHHGRFLRAGDRLEGQITGLGVQRNRCVAS